MKRRASGNHRTGQPRCVQFTAKAANSLSPVRRSHAALWAVMPAQGRGDASVRVTTVVSPILKSPSLPTARQTIGTFRRSGARTNPTNGTPSAPHPAPSPTLTRAKKRRLSGEMASEVSGSVVGGSLLWVMANLSDPVQEGSAEHGHSDEADEERAHDAPGEERHAKCEQRRCWRLGRQWFRGTRGPSEWNGAPLLAHAASTLVCGACGAAWKRPTTARIAP